MNSKNKFNCKEYRQRKKQKIMDNLLNDYNVLMESVIESETSFETSTTVTESQSISDESGSAAENSEVDLANDIKSQSLILKLQEWIVDSQTPQVHCDKLLKIMKESSMPTLPQCTSI